MDDERTIYDDEKMQYQRQSDEATQYDDPNASGCEDETTEIPEGQKADEPAKQPKWKKVAVGAGAGIMLGGAAVLFSSSAPLNHTEGEEGGNAGGHPDWTDGKVDVASSVSDDMSFAQAFAAARDEVGAGGVFEWRGNIYNTYTAEEWDNMSAAERDEYASHFSWHDDGTAHDMASASDAQQEQGEEVQITEATPAGDGEDVAQVEPVIVDDVQVTEATPAAAATEEVAVVNAEHDVQVLGVVHDAETGTNIGGLRVDGQDVVLIDVDGDSTFDVLGADRNQDHRFSDNELVDISGENITVDDLGGVSATSGPDATADPNMYATGGSDIDYSTDVATYDV